jgi:hypothetical protein
MREVCFGLLVLLTVGCAGHYVGQTWVEREKFNGMCDNAEYLKVCEITTVNGERYTFNCEWDRL